MELVFIIMQIRLLSLEVQVGVAFHLSHNCLHGCMVDFCFCYCHKLFVSVIYYVNVYKVPCITRFLSLDILISYFVVSIMFCYLPYIL